MNPAVLSDASVRSLLARVKTHIELYRAQRDNARYANEMEALARQRARSLMHAERLAPLGTLSAGIAHEINNPTTFISTGIHVIESCWNDACAHWDGNTGLCYDNGTNKRADNARKQIPAMIKNIKSGVARIDKIVSALKAYAH